MSLLSEYGLIPDAFDSTQYSSDAIADVHLQELKDVFLEEALVRDLRNGDWCRTVFADLDSYHKRAKELLRKLVNQSRLATAPSACAESPTNNIGWCREALDSNKALRLRGILTMAASAASVTDANEKAIVCGVEKLRTIDWWRSRSATARPRRNINDYLDHLRLVLRWSNSLMFIDPHFDPSEARYGGVSRLFAETIAVRHPPVIEIHRVCYRGSGRNREIITNQLEQIFRDYLQSDLARIGVTIQVFVWDDFHDRFLISNLIGVHMSNGFDVSPANDLTTWSRMGREQRDEVQREFDPNAGHHKCRLKFAIP